MAAVRTTIYGQVGDGPMHPLGSLEVTHPEHAERDVAALLRSIADEMEKEGNADLARLEEMFSGDES